MALFFLSPLLSSVAMCFTAANFVVSILKQYHTYVVYSKNRVAKLWVQAALAALLTVLSILLLVFSFTKSDWALGFLLSSFGGILMVHKVGLPIVELLGVVAQHR